MDLTLLFAQLVGPVLLLRALSIVLDRAHFGAMLDGLEREITTVSFSLFPIALFMVCAALALHHDDLSSPAGWIVRLVAWGGLLKASALILFPKAVMAKARLLGQAGFLNVVLVVCFVVGAYLTWFGYAPMLAR